MFFINVIDAILFSQFNFKKFLFEDFIGISTKTANKYLTLSVPVKSRQFTQIKNTLKHSSQRAGKPMATEVSKIMLSAFEAIETNSVMIMPGIRKGCELSIENICKQYDIDPASPELWPHPFHYSFCFIDAAGLPRRQITHRPVEWSSILGTFPYSAISESDSYYCLDISEHPDFSPSDDARFNGVFKESISGVMAAMYLDFERHRESLNQDMAIFWEFVKQAWDEENTAAFFFKFKRKNSRFNTHEAFYKDLSKRFTGMDLESVKTSYKRWCKTGSLKDEQWLKLAGVEDEINDEYISLRFWFILAQILKEVRRVGVQSNPDYGFDGFYADLMRWCEVIKKELPFESWQPFKAAS